MSEVVFRKKVGTPAKIKRVSERRCSSYKYESRHLVQKTKVGTHAKSFRGNPKS
ncbi:hypothetical protein LEP1GSC060_3405 [Leptospira weilii serovar Ranarum str. ICFT]|uniref:Uncharacterized protein n=1 Tax=Leptospira weilii serovar Ranarum str. ICFT TaxID=1218598 RepID=N1WCL0_9LEPT|nr:hypothetical protein [Leptospira weilii]EMY76685.1 hypothetical protein LEP1GSC060_3405 [Leptospira weilii serovar Ranarum str. ICFT]